MNERKGYTQMRRMGAALLILLALCVSIPISRAATSGELIASVEPRVSHLKLKSDSLRALVGRQVIVKDVSTKSSRQMAALGVVIADASPEAFIEAYRSLLTFKQNSATVQSGMMSATPSLSDLESLTIDDKDLYSLSKADARSSGVKLSEQEIAKLHEIAGSSTRLTPQMKAKLTAAYKKILLDRTRTYLMNGAQALGTYSDKEEPVVANDAFLSLAREQAETSGHCGDLYSYLENYPQTKDSGYESFVYWAKQRFGELKPVINIVQVTVHRHGHRIFLASKQLYSSHYTEAGLSVAELIPFVDGDGVARTIIIYTIRLQVDMLGGTMGFMKKRMAQPRILSTLKESLNGLRATMESLSRATNQEKAAL
jgi:hypothetical protein